MEHFPCYQLKHGVHTKIYLRAKLCSIERLKLVRRPVNPLTGKVQLGITNFVFPLTA